jgi:hypothetical protein
MLDNAERMERLRQIVQNAQCDEEAYWMIRRLATGILTHLGIEESQAAKFLDDNIRNHVIPGLAGYEQFLHTELNYLGVFKKLPERMTERAYAWYRKLIGHLEPGGEILDLGGGSGELAQIVRENFNHQEPTEVTIADALDWRKVDMPFLRVEDNKIHVKDGAFVSAMAITSYHHSDNPEALVYETFRVAKKRVVFIESVTQNLLLYMVGCWIDWFYNHIIHFSPDIAKKINVPCRFMPATAWEQLIWRLTGLKPTSSDDLGFYQILNPENHWRFVYDK